MQLQITSNKLFLEIKEYEQATIHIDNWIIKDNYIPNVRGHLGTYSIMLTNDISTIDELYDEFPKGKKVAERITDLITYIIGVPLDYHSSNSFYGQKKKIVTNRDIIAGWESNYEEVKKTIDSNEFNIEFLGNIHWAIIKESPLKELDIMLRNYSGLDYLAKLLIYYHTNALRQDSDIRYLLIGKSLEIVNSILPDEKNRQKRFQTLPTELREIFKGKDISWLFELSNYRLETRHIINKKSEDLLHKEMTEDECFNYLFLSENLIHYIIRDKLGLKFALMEHE